MMHTEHPVAPIGDLQFDRPDLDHGALADHFRPGGPWAVMCGSQVDKRRKLMRLSVADLADLAHLSRPSIYKIQQGRMIPSPEVQAAIAVHLLTTPEDLWPMPSRDEIIDLRTDGNGL